MTPEEVQEIKDLAAQGMSVRAIAKKLGRDRRTIRSALGLAPKPTAPSKLEPFKEKIRELLAQGLTGPRVLRELRSIGYTGGHSILNAFIRTIRPPKKQQRKVFRRFETPPAKEAQADWSPYRVPIAGVETTVHCFSLVMAYSRRLWIGFFRNERLPSLLQAHVEALGTMGGCPETILYDNMTQVTLGRAGGKPIWNPAFLEFAKHYGFEPKVCRPRDPNRRGKGERPFAWIGTDLLKGARFDSWDDLNAKARVWLDTVANVRVHSTTRRRVDEMFAQEKPLLIALPSLSYPTDRRESRKVGVDGTVAVDGSYFPVPAHLVGQYVTVRIYPHHVEVLDGAGKVAVTHRIPDRPTRLRVPTEAVPPRAASVSRTAMETAFLARFPRAQEFLDGLHHRMKALLPIHLRQIERLVDLYGEGAARVAIERAQEYGNFNALAVTRILETAYPHVVPLPPMIPLVSNPAAFGALDDVDPGSPRDYTVDSAPPTKENSDGQEA
jgi:transposase